MKSILHQLLIYSGIQFEILDNLEINKISYILYGLSDIKDVKLKLYTQVKNVINRTYSGYEVSSALNELDIIFEHKMILSEEGSIIFLNVDDAPTTLPSKIQVVLDNAGFIPASSDELDSSYNFEFPNRLIVRASGTIEDVIFSVLDEIIVNSDILHLEVYEILKKINRIPCVDGENIFWFPVEYVDY